MFRRLAAAGLLLALIATGVVFLVVRHNGPARAAPGVFKVAGDRLVEPDGNRIQLVGVGRSGTEYACLDGKDVFVGPDDEASVEGIASWNVDVVRLPLNEDCWLGINGVPHSTSGPAYQATVSSYVDLLLAHRIGVILDLHWSAAGTRQAHGQQKMPDADHAGLFWTQVATAYRNRPGVAFELYNEPYGVSWSCWKDGCFVPGAGSANGYEAVGMQKLIDKTRATGATNPIIVDGLAKASSLKDWKRSGLHDPVGQLIAGWHLYGPDNCTDKCWRSVVDALQGIPVIVTELGETD
ncbi:MAG TPA: cellulase family glycosylhydrolase, partial [Acidimicrobiales bacterium]|nr:cellulase family glycosylhydrolase [Acidimicrobiales bacterium]